MLLPRLLTGILGGALLLGVIHTGNLPFFLVILGISGGLAGVLHFERRHGVCDLACHWFDRRIFDHVVRFFERRQLGRADG